MIERLENQEGAVWLVHGDHRIWVKRGDSRMWECEFDVGGANLKAKNSSLERLDQFVGEALGVFENNADPVEDGWWHRLCLSFGDAMRFELANIWTYFFALLSLIGVAMFFPLNSAFEMTATFLLLVLIFRGNKS